MEMSWYVILCISNYYVKIGFVLQGFYLDNAVRKEVRGLKVFCEKSECDWKGPLSHYEVKSKSLCQVTDHLYHVT